MFYNLIDVKEIPDVMFAHIYSCYNYGTSIKATEGNIEIAYIKSGQLKLEIAGESYCVKEGSFLVFPHKYDFILKSEENKEHIHYTISAMTSDNVKLSKEKPKKIGENTLCIPMCIENCAETENLFRLLCDGIKIHQNSGYIGKTQSGIRFLYLLCELARISNKKGTNEKDNILDMRIKKYIEKNLSRKITLSVIAENIGKNPNYLNQVFRKSNNMSIISYVNLMKMKKAASLIANEQKSLKEAAQAVGIHDINYFSRLFGIKMGMTVSEFKSNLIDNTYFLCDLDEVSK